MLRETLCQAAFQAVFEEKIAPDLQDRLFSQARSLSGSFQALNKRYLSLDTLPKKEESKRS